jgi:hypothetical protein
MQPKPGQVFLSLISEEIGLIIARRPITSVSFVGFSLAFAEKKSKPEGVPLAKGKRISPYRVGERR